jgi:DNA-binding NarL/FixJ family response regulator
MKNNLSVIISGSPFFTYKVGEIVETMLPQSAQIRAASVEKLLQTLQKNKFNFVLVEENTEEAPVKVKKIKEIAANSKVILFNDVIKKEIKEADCVLPAKISKVLGKKLKQIFFPEPIKLINENAEKCIIVSEKPPAIKEIVTVCLTKRKMELFKGIFENKTNKEIADELFRDERTVEDHREELYVLIDSFSAVDVVKFAIRQSWTDSKANLNDEFTKLLESGKKRFYITYEKTKQTSTHTKNNTPE